MRFRNRSDHKIDRLASSDLFQGCSRSALRAVSGLVDELSCPAGTVLAVQGEQPDELLLVSEGIAVADRDGERVADRIRAIGQEPLAGGGRHECTVRADTPVRLLVVHRRDREALMATVPALTQRLERTVVPARPGALAPVLSTP